MHFSSTSRNIYLSLDGGVWLCCECQVAGIADFDGNVGYSTNRFPLHNYFHVAYDSPKLRYGRDGGYALTDHSHLDISNVSLIGGTILKARVKSISGTWADASMCLDFFLTNDFGTLTCSEPSQYIGESVAMVAVSKGYDSSTGHSTIPLTGLCIGLDGQLHASSVDLSLHYENHNGLFKKKANGHFGDTSKDPWFDSYGHLNCALRNWDGYYGYPIDYEVYKDVRNVDGVLTIHDPAGFWDAEGAFFRILEEIPVLGYAVAVADFARGDPDEAQRAIAECTLSTIAAVCCFFATTLLGPVGACLAAAAINTGAMLAKEGMKANMGEPSFFTRSVGAAVTGFLFSEFLVIAGVGLDGLVGSYMDMLEAEFVASAIEGMVVDVGTWGGKKALKTLTKEEFKFIMNTVLDVVKNGGSLEDAQAQVDAKIKQWFEETQAPELKKKLATKMTSLGYTWGDQTIVDDVYQNIVAADYGDDARLQKAIDAACRKIIPYGSDIYQTVTETIVANGYERTDDLINKVTALVTKYVFREKDDLVRRITYLLSQMGLVDPSKIRKIRMSITRIHYTYTNTLVTKLLDKVPEYDYNSSDQTLDEAMKTIFAQFPASDRNSLDDAVSKAIYAAGFFKKDGDVANIEADMVRNGFVYDSMVDLNFQLSKLAHQYCSFDHHIMPSAKVD